MKNYVLGLTSALALLATIAFAQSVPVGQDGDDYTFSAQHVTDIVTGVVATIQAQLDAIEDKASEEKGSFTPTILVNTTAPTSVDYQPATAGRYIRRGSSVTAQFRLEFKTYNYSGGAGNLYVDGLPFTVEAGALAVASGTCETSNVNYDAGVTTVTLRPTGGFKKALFIESGDNIGASGIVYTQVPSSSTSKILRCQITYITDDP